ncbi:MAG: hypothetical protein MUP14_00320 [Dehalococcoidia bacterium]|nr:hypothetical protein [Dehalococcoidia bacterium]
MDISPEGAALSARLQVQLFRHDGFVFAWMLLSLVGDDAAVEARIEHVLDGVGREPAPLTGSETAGA